MRSFHHRVWLGDRLVPVQAIFWDREGDLREIRYRDANGDSIAVGLSSAVLMASTGVMETGTNRFVFEGDVVEIEYQRGNSLCVVEWCGVKSALILKPLRGNRPKNQLHFRLSGKKKITILGNIYENPGLLNQV